ncbi:MAG: hypothetical protein HYW37_02195 [Candidatus Colwellbacteria bacterium]|nr:hypothetical protein [Candidatus Colwellbacteria bacterium]
MLHREELWRRLRAEVDRQLQHFGIVASADISHRARDGDEVVLGFIARNETGPPVERGGLLLEYGAASIVARLAKWTRENEGLDERILSRRVQLFEELEAAGIDQRELRQFVQDLAEAIPTPR